MYSTATLTRNNKRLGRERQKKKKETHSIISLTNFFLVGSPLSNSRRHVNNFPLDPPSGFCPACRYTSTSRIARSPPLPPWPARSSACDTLDRMSTAAAQLACLV